MRVRPRWAAPRLLCLLAAGLLLGPLTSAWSSAAAHSASPGLVEEWGDDYYAQDGFDSGQTSLRGDQSSALPLPLTLQTGAVGVEAGLSHSLALVSGNVWAWGRSSEGQLGNGTTGSGSPGSPTPVEVRRGGTAILGGVTAVAAGGFHSLALTSAGNVYAWGSDSSGQLGDGTTMNSTYALEVRVSSTTFLTGVRAIAAGRYHSLALKSDGTVWSWGSNSNGQVGDGTTTDSGYAVQVTDSTGAALTGVTDIGSGSGSWHSLAVKSDGSVWAWGYNFSGQLGDGSKSDGLRAVQVKTAAGKLTTASTTPLAWPLHRLAAGNFHSLVLDAGGAVWGWGSNAEGQLDDGAATGETTAVQAAGLSQVGSIAAGQNHSLALLAGGEILAWGSDGSGQLGDGAHGAPPCSCRPVPAPVAGTAGATDIAAGGDNSLAVLLGPLHPAAAPPGHLTAWGDNSLGQLGDGVDAPTEPTSTTPVTSPPGTWITAVSAGGGHSLALGSDQQAYQWGEVTSGGPPLPTRVPLPDNASAVAIADGARHHLVLTDSGQVLAWGGNSEGQLGNGTLGTSPDDQRSLHQPLLPPHVTATAIAAGGIQSLALTSDGLYAWGGGGGAGGGAGASSGVPDVLGGIPFVSGTVSENAVPLKVKLPPGSTVSSQRGALGAGFFHSLVIANDGAELLAWGSNSFGQLGTDPASDPTSPEPVLGLPAQVRIKEVAAGLHHSLALTDTGQLWAWGDNSFGQLGTGSFASTGGPVSVLPGVVVSHISAGWNHSLAIDQNGRVLSWGEDDRGQLGRASVSSCSPPDGSSPVPCDPSPGIAGVGGIATAVSAGVGSYWVCPGCFHPSHSLAVVSPPSALPDGVKGRASALVADSLTVSGATPGASGGLATCDTGVTATQGTTLGHGAFCPGSVPSGTPVTGQVNGEDVTISPPAPATGSPGTVTGRSTIASFQLTLGGSTGTLLDARGMDARAMATCSTGTGRGTATGSSTVTSLTVAGVRVATQPVGSRIIFNPTGHDPITLYGNPIWVNPTGGRDPMAIVTLNYSSYDPVSHTETVAPIAVTFPRSGPLRSIITGTLFISYAQAACP